MAARHQHNNPTAYSHPVGYDFSHDLTFGTPLPIISPGHAGGVLTYHQEPDITLFALATLFEHRVLYHQHNNSGIRATHTEHSLMALTGQ